MENNFIVAIDFDGTITDDKKSKGYPFTGEVRQEAVVSIKKLKEKGCKLILWTSRYGWSLKEAIAICKYYKLPFDTYNKNIPGVKSSKKIYADFYIDNKSFLKEIDWKIITDYILQQKEKKQCID